MEGEKAFIISAIQLGTFQFRDLTSALLARTLIISIWAGCVRMHERAQ